MPPKRTSRARGKRTRACATVPPTSRATTSPRVTKQDLLREIEERYGFDAAAMVDQLSDDRATIAEMEEFVREIATEVGVEPSGLRDSLNALFERKAVSPRRGAHHCRNARSYYDLDTMMYLVPDDDLLVDSSNICYKKDELIRQYRSDLDSHRRFANPEGILFSELTAKNINDTNMRTLVETMARTVDGGEEDEDKDEDGNTALMRASEYGRVEIVRALMERMTDDAIATCNRRGDTALMIAAVNGHVEVVHVLISRMTDEAIARRNIYGHTALMWAAIRGHAEVVRLLMDKMSDRAIRLAANGTALMFAVRNGHVEVVRLLMDRMSDVAIAYQNRDDETALMYAAENGCAEIARLLISRMSDEAIAYQNVYGQTALMFAANNNHVEVVRLLMDKMSDEAIALKDEDGKTALMFAAENGRIEVVRMLMSRMTDEAIAAQNRDDQTALMLATNKEYAEVVRVLMTRTSR